jgi:ABC-type polysaccharide/polyol phosphate export permease
MKYLLNPSARLVGSFFAVAFVLLAASALLINFGSEEVAGFGFLPVLLGLTVLVMALVSLAMRKLNLKYGPPED